MPRNRLAQLGITWVLDRFAPVENRPPASVHRVEQQFSEPPDERRASAGVEPKPCYILLPLVLFYIAIYYHLLDKQTIVLRHSIPFCCLILHKGTIHAYLAGIFFHGIP